MGPSICTLEGCGRPVRARGLCSSHYQKRNTPEAKAPLREKRDDQAVERVSGLLVSKATAKKIRRAAKATKRSEHAVIVEVVERFFDGK